ncbi:MAG: glycosyltransferase family 4 protein [Acetobacter sp.]|nr:glycosyltransferase family 4 protein [Bacteroides sp.]MCM1341570.1 glycosyltransferase family 4 protein [Acetobacter sp.]MCM1433647.1 glycosyltransferase family 4 protein [Clostridiales bacterium]
MKILFVATVRSHIGQFHMPFIEELKKHGCEVHGAYKDNSADKKGLDLSALDKVFEVPFSRSPYSTSNIKAYKVLKKIIDENDYDVIHCHTPMGAVVARLASKNARKRGTKVIYTAHGFHFYNGASKKNWLMFYPVEKYLSKYTDCLITINQEDYDLAVNNNFNTEKIYHVNGVGVDIEKFHSADKDEKTELRKEYNFKSDDFLMIYPADFCQRKNQNMLFDTLKILLDKHSNFHLLLPGLDELAQPYIDYAKQLGVYDNVHVLGYRRDIDKLVAMSDVSISSSRQEGLPINLIEAMAIGNAIVATDVRGNNDLVKDGENGFLVKLNDSSAMADAILKLYESTELMNKFQLKNKEMVEKYSVNNVISHMIEIYKELNIL